MPGCVLIERDWIWSQSPPRLSLDAADKIVGCDPDGLSCKTILYGIYTIRLM